MWLGDSLREKPDISAGGMGSDDDEDEAAMGGDLIDFELESPRNTLAMPPVRDESVAGLSSPGNRDMCSFEDRNGPKQPEKFIR
jgi:hypothetical protein